MAIAHTPIQRGGIRSAGYDRATRILEIAFDNGSVTQYSGVGEEVARRFLGSSAPASYLRDNIEDEFSARRVR